MDKSAIIERLRALRREASEIKAATRVYWARSAHTKVEIELHQRQQERLEEIRKEARALVRYPGAKTDIHFLNNRERDGPQD